MFIILKRELKIIETYFKQKHFLFSSTALVREISLHFYLDENFHIIHINITFPSWKQKANEMKAMHSSHAFNDRVRIACFCLGNETIA